MTDRFKQDVEYWMQKVHPIIGGTIVSMCVQSFDGKALPMLHIAGSDGKYYEVYAMADDEGNDMGWMEVDEDWKEK